MPAHEQDGDEHRHQRQGHGHHGEADLLAADERGAHAGLAFLAVAHDVFQHHDGVVHHETHRQRQRHEREVVEAEAGKLHDGEGADDRGGQRQRADQGGAQVAQEQEDHAHHQHDGQQQGELRTSPMEPLMKSARSWSTWITASPGASRVSSGSKRLHGLRDLPRRWRPAGA